MKKIDFMNKRFNVKTVRDSIRLNELMRLIPDDEFVIIYTPLKEFGEKFREEEALFNGQAGDWWEETAKKAGMREMREMVVVGFKASELETVAGPVILIVAKF